MSVALSVVALLVAIASAIFASRAVGHAKRSADAAEAAVRDQHTPRLAIDLDGLGPGEQVPQAYYRVRNDGPQDLDEVTVYRPRPADGITYWIGLPGQTGVDDDINLGALSLGQHARFTLFCGAAAELPEFHVRIECRSGKDRWAMLERLPSPRPPSH